MNSLNLVRVQPIEAHIGLHYERLLRSFGGAEFGDVAKDCISSITGGFRRMYLFESSGREEIDVRYYDVEPNIENAMPMYLERYFAKDPLHDAFRVARDPMSMAMLRLRPDSLPSGGYRRDFFEEGGIIERLSIVQRGHDEWRVLNLARHSSEGFLSDREVSSIVCMAWLLLPMLAMGRPHNAKTRSTTIGELAQRFAARFPSLTIRERQVCARAAIGMTVEATALDLGIAKTSIQTYRRRAYQRLNVTSPYELSSLVSH